MCRELEALGRAGTVEGAAEKVTAVDAEFARVRGAFEMERQRRLG